MFVRPGLCRTSLEVSKCRDQKSRLPHEPFGATVRGRPGLEHAESPALEVLDAVLTMPEIVVQAKDLSDQARPEMKRRHCALLLRRATCDAEENFSLRIGQERARNFEPFTQSDDELTRRDQIRQGQCRIRRAQQCVLDRAKQ